MTDPTQNESPHIESGEPDTRKQTGDNYRPRADVVADWIREQILHGHLAPGERIRQEAVAEICGTSRIPVREALNRLRDEGLVTLTSHVGARVATFDLGELHEIYALRERLEPLALSESVPFLTEDQHRELREMAGEMELRASAGDSAAWLELDRRFHLATYAGAPMPRLLELVHEFWNRTQQYRRAYMLIPASYELAHLEHRLLVEAIERRSASDAAVIQRLHIHRTIRSLDDHPDLMERIPPASS
jgi:DNA-binding GntR family transcriptional regulator